MLYLTCTTITSVDLAHYGVSRAKDWVSVDCGTISCYRTPKEAYALNSQVLSEMKFIFALISKKKN